MILASGFRSRFSLFVLGIAFFGLPLWAQKDFNLSEIKDRLQKLIDAEVMQSPGEPDGDLTPGITASVVYLGSESKPTKGKQFSLVSGYSNPNKKSRECPICPIRMKKENWVEAGSVTKSMAAGLMLFYFSQSDMDMPFRLSSNLFSVNPHLVDDRFNGFVTIQQLLGMTSGIKDFKQNTNYQVIVHPEDVLEDALKIIETGGDSPVTLHRFIDEIKKLDPYAVQAGEPTASDSASRFWTASDVYNFVGYPNFAPGTSFSYSNTNFVIVGELLQTLGNSWDISYAFHEHVFSPYGIKDVRLGGYEEIPLMEMSFGFSSNGTNISSTSRIAFLTSYWTAGAFIAQPDDIAKWALTLWSPEIKIMTDSYYKQMTTFTNFGYDLYTYAVGAKVPGITWNAYGLGTQRVEVSLDDEDKEIVTILGHNGETRGFITGAFYLDDRKVAFSVTGNGGNMSTTGKSIIELERDFTRVLMEYKSPKR